MVRKLSSPPLPPLTVLDELHAAEDDSGETSFLGEKSLGNRSDASEFLAERSMIGRKDAPESVRSSSQSGSDTADTQRSFSLMESLLKLHDAVTSRGVITEDEADGEAGAAGGRRSPSMRSDHSELMAEFSNTSPPTTKSVPESSRSPRVGSLPGTEHSPRDSLVDGLQGLHLALSQQHSSSSDWPTELVEASTYQNNVVWPSLHPASRPDSRASHAPSESAATPPWPSLQPSEAGLDNNNEEVWPSIEPSEKDVASAEPSPTRREHLAAEDADGHHTDPIERLKWLSTMRELSEEEIEQLDAAFELDVAPLRPGICFCTRCKDFSTYALEEPGGLCFLCSHFRGLDIKRCAVRGRPSRYLLPVQGVDVVTFDI